MSSKTRTLNKAQPRFNWSQYSQILPILLVIICLLTFIIVVGHWQFTGGNY